MINKLQITERLIKLPSEMKEKELGIFTLSQQENALHKEYEGLELKELANINMVVDDKGKKIYPNAESRQAALQERLENNNEYHKKIAECDFIKHNLEIEKINFNELKRELSTLRMLIDLWKSDENGL